MRDGGCRFPGCGRRFTDAHHVQHWANGGETSLGNCLLLCGHHHRLVHEGGWTVRWWGDGHPVFIDPHGHEHYEGRRRPTEAGEDAVQQLIGEHRQRGIEPHGWTNTARWRRAADIPATVWCRAAELL
ncbi:MAG: HNH endonuclease signature motif containing protein [Longimicrobiaceae bacterium]